MQQTLFGEPVVATPKLISETTTLFDEMQNNLEKGPEDEETKETPNALFDNDPRTKTLVEAGYELGSTTVFRSEGQYLFVGDISHCGYKAIQHNAKLIRNEMMKRNCSYGHMNYNDLPTFDKSFDKKHFDSDNQIYKHDIYTWDLMDAPIVFKLFGDAEVGEVYYSEGD
jgi:hypothetical protein